MKFREELTLKLKSREYDYSQCFKISKVKFEYIKCNFSSTKSINNGDVKIENKE